MNEGYAKATSLNLPKVDLEMFLSYLNTHDSYYAAELRGTKTVRLVLLLSISIYVSIDLLIDTK